MDPEFRIPASRQRVATPYGVWFDNDLPPGDRAGQEDDRSRPRTRLLEDSTRRADDEQVIQLIEGLPAARTPATPAYAVAVLNESGEVYREVWLWDMGEALVFTARMNASGFSPAPSTGTGGPYHSVFMRR